MNERELLELKEDIENAKQKVSELKGERQALMNQLKDQWNCDSVESAEKKLKEKMQSQSKVNEQIETGLRELENKFEE